MQSISNKYDNRNLNKNSPLLYYETYLAGKDMDWIVMIHGAGGSTKTWKRQVDQLSTKFNLLIIDLPGHGQNSLNADQYAEYSFRFVAEKIWEVVDHLNIVKAHLMGVSLGTILCLEIREMHPERVQSIVMAGAIVRLNFKLKLLANLSLALAKLIGYRRFYSLSAFIMMPRNNHKKSRQVFKKEAKVLKISEFKKWTALYFKLNQKLSELFHTASSIPHLIIMGSQDHLFLPSAKVYAEFHKNTDLKILPNCGHVVSIEKAQHFNEICLEYLFHLRNSQNQLQH